jgi:glutaminyl-tRNA synthetase
MSEASSEEAFLTANFALLGLGEKPLKEAFRNKKISKAWTEVFSDVEIPAGVNDGKVGGLLSALVTATKDIGGLDGRRAYVVDRILEGKLKSNAQVEAAVKYIKAVKGEIDSKVFEKDCGVGEAIFSFPFC